MSKVSKEIYLKLHALYLNLKVFLIVIQLTLLGLFLFSYVKNIKGNNKSIQC